MKKLIRNLQSSFPNSFFYLILVTLFLNFSTMTAQNKDMMVRIAEIEIEPSFLQEYLDILNEESSESVRLEPGVISIFPMFQKENHYLI
jgi:hypothetical protein